ncbi:bifunctional diguanylate cyclase/phosphodiesterase [Actinoplanes sp. Pm04-4]|uniref:Bifunctional diguanylate cyclase/phosphodiesterase n=1 Tax=Paractinoplanes pyxinae TaxID=2997416 RepID=A0ABT4BB24_9ACTN|nr:bifunctional diguanylate cyclase/phosphodiesterase [Actinoplanes pyxinae]MCY1143724.1 bifunctional diguanylate cyclase/phosphodiesterase [Actinoplanes pyxinae]
MLVVVPLLRRKALLLLAVGLVIVDAVWLSAGLTHAWSHPLLGWLPLPLATLLAGHACWQVTRHRELDVETRRFWRYLTVACTLFTAGVVANTIDAVGHGAPSQRVGPVSLAFYLSVLGVVLWALLQLPSWQRTRNDWIRFGLDLIMVVITVAALVWHLSLRNHHEWTTQTGSGGAVLAITVVGFLSMATFVKVAFAGAGRLDRRAVYTLATGSAVSAAFGSFSPFLITRPYLSSSLIAVPVAALSIHVAAVIQQHAGSRTPPPRRTSRRVSIVPYLAVAVTDALLLLNSRRDMTETAIMEIAVVTLTGVVVIRQIIALRDNSRLLNTVDAQLSDLRRYQERLEHQATHDKLTETANRALLEQHIDTLLADGQPLHLALLDIDDFKAVNDRLGHHVGDALLTVISHRLTAVVGELGLVARLGGDEFAVAVPAPAGQVEALLERILTAVRQPAELDEHTTVPAISIGVTASRTGDNPSALLRRADVAMYTAKTAGGHRWHWFDQSMDDAADDAARLSADLRQALPNGQIFALYQPIIDLTTGLPVGGEVLMRWQHPERGLISPDLFIPLAERTGCIVDLGYWILENAFRQTAVWQDRYGDHTPAKISVNVSARQLSEPDFVDRVQEILRRTGADPGRLVLEVTETAVFATAVAVHQLERLKALGVRIALDDFGTGHSSLSLLLDCPVDLLKVDKSFVSGAAADQAGALIVKNLIGFTSDFAIEAVAEGVETPEQAARLRQFGYQYAQGYLYARPMPATDFEHYFTAATVMTPIR